MANKKKKVYIHCFLIFSLPVAFLFVLLSSLPLLLVLFLQIIHACGQRASRQFKPGRHRGRNMKSTHIEIVVKEVEVTKKGKQEKEKKQESKASVKEQKKTELKSPKSEEKEQQTKQEQPQQSTPTPKVQEKEEIKPEVKEEKKEEQREPEQKKTTEEQEEKKPETKVQA